MKRVIPITLALMAASMLGIAAPKSGLTITLPNKATVTLSNEKLLALPRTSETATSHGVTHTYQGSNLRDVLEAAGARSRVLSSPIYRN